MFTTIVILTTCVMSAAAKVYTGFNHGAFWSEQSNVKRYADFYHSFQLAKNLTNTPVPFDSARLYTCLTAGTKDDPTEAFQAAIDTGTNLLLGMWVSPGATGQPNDSQVQSELTALGKGFEQHGQKLADLVIGLSVGSEDVYRFNSGEVGLSSETLIRTIKTVRERIASSQFAKYLHGKPIGHTDTASYSVMPGTDFAGMNAYPFWEGKHINAAEITFMSALEDTQRRASNTPVWITELGWPVIGDQINEAVASPENYQRYWSEVGCQVFGKYNTFWFELLRDSHPEQPDWGLLDTKTYQTKIKNLNCGAHVSPPAPTAGTVLVVSTPSSGKPKQTTLSTIYSPPLSSGSVPSTLTTDFDRSIIVSTGSMHTTHITLTSTTTVVSALPPLLNNAELVTMYLTTTTCVATSPSSSPLIDNNTGGPQFKDKITACIGMMDWMGDGVFMPVVTYAADISICKPPPRFTGPPFTMITGPTTAPVGSMFRTSAKSTLRITSTTAPKTPTFPSIFSLLSISLNSSTPTADPYIAASSFSEEARQRESSMQAHLAQH
ncbi:GPI-anchored cell wall beta-1,3-endoglucanase EglC [Stagonosporopsis vannaccii]|nr:GPI-anchored cell wall beta-1,3-endoglucanase EglC [Stagonosporopsis vannaccii]